MMMRRTSASVMVGALLAIAAPAVRAAALDNGGPVQPNDNTRAAGVRHDDTVVVRLRAASGQWRPEGPTGPALTVDAFGEEGGALTVPGPLVRVTEGTTLVFSVRNELAFPLRIHGLCARDGSACPPVEIAPAGARELRFAAGRAGTYHYWATAMGAPMPFRELAGAFVVDPRGETPVQDRILVITEWTSLTAGQLRGIIGADVPSEEFLAQNPRFTFVINGLSWPATERLTYRRGDDVRWRVINLSSQPHPLHLHGFYFTVLAVGDGISETHATAADRRRVVTQVMPPGGTLLMQWTPEREGNWLFHCHIMHHVSPERRLASDAGHHDHVAHDAGLGMAGMVLGITVLPREMAADRVSNVTSTRREITMVIERRTDGSAGFVVADDGLLSPHDEAVSPGPALVLTRGEPVEITVLNHLGEPTSIHWHGLEIESYYDGVHGWSGDGARLAPLIAPGGQFAVRFTPPRAGTFIYHTHLHDYRQLSGGLYGPLIVAEPGETFDPETDHIVVLGRRDASAASGILEDPDTLLINGARRPRWSLATGRPHRLRLINITPDDNLAVSLVGRDGLVSWRVLAKDGVAVPLGDGAPRPARTPIAPGETYDLQFESTAPRAHLWLEVRSAGGKWQAQGEVILR